MNVTVKYRQESKVSLSRATGNNDDRFENSTFSVGYEESYPFPDPPEGDTEFETWNAARQEFRAEKTAEIRAQVEAELQADIDKFIEENQ